MLYRNVAVQIRTEFGDGRFSPGTLLPSENDFVEAFAVSRTTVRKALRALEEEGFIERRQGQGTFLKKGALTRRVSSGMDFLSHTSLSGVRPGTRLVSYRRRVRSIAEQTLFETPAADEVFELVRLRLLNGEACVLQTSVLPFTKLTELPRRQFESRSLYKIVEQEFGARVGRIREVLSCAIAPVEVREALGLDDPTAVFVSHRIAHDQDGHVIEVSRNYIRPDRYSFVQESSSAEVMA